MCCSKFTLRVTQNNCSRSSSSYQFTHSSLTDIITQIFILTHRMFLSRARISYCFLYRSHFCRFAMKFINSTFGPVKILYSLTKRFSVPTCSSCLISEIKIEFISWEKWKTHLHWCSQSPCCCMFSFRDFFVLCYDENSSTNSPSS